MVPMILQAFNEMRKISKSKMWEVIRIGGKHNEKMKDRISFLDQRLMK